MRRAFVLSRVESFQRAMKAVLEPLKNLQAAISQTGVQIGRLMRASNVR